MCIRDRLADDLFKPEYELAISIKDIDHRYYEAQRFKIINEKSRNIIYTHLASTEAFICLQANKEVYVTLEVDSNVKPPENLIKSDDIHGLENVIYQSVKEFTDFTAQNAQLSSKEEQSYAENIKLNAKLVRLTMLEVALIVGLGAVQYFIVKGFINSKK